MQGFVIILVLLALMWFLIIRPQRRRQLQGKQLVDQLEAENFRRARRAGR